MKCRAAEDLAELLLTFLGRRRYRALEVKTIYLIFYFYKNGRLFIQDTICE